MLPRISTDHKNRNHRSNAIAYERCVAADRPAACNSPRYAVTAETGSPDGPTNRYGSHTSPVSTTAPTRTTTSESRSLGAFSVPNTGTEDSWTPSSQPVTDTPGAVVTSVNTPTADTPGDGPSATFSSPPPPRGAWCALSRQSPSPPACRAPRRRGSTLRVVHPLLDLVQERINGHRPSRPLFRAEPGITQRHVVGHRLVITASHAAAARNPPVKSNASKISMISSLLFTHWPSALDTFGREQPARHRRR